MLEIASDPNNYDRFSADKWLKNIKEKGFDLNDINGRLILRWI